MSGRLLRSCAIIALSLALLYSGVAWAMAACFDNESHSEHVVMEDHHHSRTTWGSSHSDDPFLPIVHCASVTQELGPVARAASTEIGRVDRAVAFHSALPAATLYTVIGNDLWLDAVFRRAAAILLPSDFSRHLFLSTLRI